MIDLATTRFQRAASIALLGLAPLGCGGAGPATPAAGTTPPVTAAPTPATDATPAGETPAGETPAGETPGAPTGDASAPSAIATPEAPPEPPPPPKPPAVEVSKPEFVGEGTVPKVDKFLDKTLKLAAQCVADHGGLPDGTGKMKVQILVTVRSKAEGVEVLKSKGVSKAARKCLRDKLKGKWVGAPTADPVGVQFEYRFELADKADTSGGK